jgi:ketosteroid isomerase-like protein
LAVSRPSRLSAEWSEAVPVSETERADAAGNLEIVFVDWLDALRRRDIERVERRMAPDVIHQGVRGDLVCRGREAVIERLRTRGARLPSVTAMELLEAGDQVLVRLCAQGLGVPVDDEGPPRGEAIVVFTLADGLIVRMDDYVTRAEALAALARAPTQ